MRNFQKAGAALLPLVVILAGCSSHAARDEQPKSQAAEVTIKVDGSGSTALIAAPAYADAIVRRAGDEVMRAQLGDSVRITNFGDRRVDNAVPVLSLKSGYRLRLPALRKQVEASLADLMAKNRASGGQGQTDIVYSLSTSNITCTPRSKIVILSDMIQHDAKVDLGRDLAEGKALSLPKPASPFLTGCSVVVLGIGMAPFGGAKNAQTLPADQVQKLTAVWRDYFEAAGVRPEDMSFTSAL